MRTTSDTEMNKSALWKPLFKEEGRIFCYF